MAYADYTYYSTSYLGYSIAEAEFPRLAMKASAALDEMTFGRAEAETVGATVEKIKKAMCAIAEEMNRQEQSDNLDGIASESQGQYSISYNANSSRMKSSQTKIEQAARVWLANTYLLFAGFNSGEYGGVSDSE